nr:phenylalanine tRNA synthetase [Gloiopeltis furcata]
MKFSWKWLKTLVNLENITLSSLITQLTLAGIEVENVEEKPEIQDITLTIHVTANRSDISCLIGVAREVATLFNLKLYNPVNKAHTENEIMLTSLAMKSNSLLDMSVSKVKELNTHLSPHWLKCRLQGCGIASSNLYADITNYINIKWGQDFNIFDISEVKARSSSNDIITIDKSHNCSEFINSMDFCHLNNDKPVDILKYKNLVLSIIGIASNPLMFCSSKTSSIIVLGQICKLSYVQKVRKNKYNKTTQSEKQLKGISRRDFISAYNEAVGLLIEISNGKVEITQQYHSPKNCEDIIKISREQIVNILGPNNKRKSYTQLKLSKKIIYNLLKQLRFKPCYKNNFFFITVPEYRKRDIKRSIDIVEEIGRVYGFEKFINNIPQYNKRGSFSRTNIVMKSVRLKLRSMGLHEIVSYSLQDRSNNHAVDLHNPLIQDQSKLRNSLIYNLLNAREYNLKQASLCLECFEIGRVFHRKANTVVEQINIAGLIGSPSFSRRSWSNKGESLSWFQAKGMLEELLETLKVEVMWKKHENNSYEKYNIKNSKIFHTHRIAIIANKEDQKQIGILGQIHSKYNSSFGINHNVYIFEINLLHLIEAINKKSSQHLRYIFQPYSNYPSITRDISLKMGLHENAESIQEKILKTKNSLIESVEILSEYKHKNYNETQYTRNLTLRIQYRASNRTLNDNDIKYIDSEIEQILEKR